MSDKTIAGYLTEQPLVVHKSYTNYLFSRVCFLQDVDGFRWHHVTEFVERGNIRKTTERTPFCIAREPMVSTTLCVDGYQVQSKAIWNTLKSIVEWLCVGQPCNYIKQMQHRVIFLNTRNIPSEMINKKFSEEGGGYDKTQLQKLFLKNNFGLKMFLEYQK